MVADFVVINPCLWPADHKHLTEFGNEQLAGIIAHFESPLHSTNFSEADARSGYSSSLNCLDITTMGSTYIIYGSWRLLSSSPGMEIC